MPSICALVLVTAVDAVRRNRKALVSSRVGLSGVVVGDDIVVKFHNTILENGCIVGENDTTWMFGLGTCYKAVYLITWDRTFSDPDPEPPLSSLHSQSRFHFLRHLVPLS